MRHLNVKRELRECFKDSSASIINDTLHQVNRNTQKVRRRYLVLKGKYKLVMILYTLINY